MKNVVVKVTSKEHGAEVIQAFKNLGVDVYDLKGSVICGYYGLFNGEFYFMETPKNSQVITLEELKAMANPYPKVMWVWDLEGEDKWKFEVLGEFEHKEIKGYITFDGGTFYVWKNAKDIEEPVEMKTPIQELLDKIKFARKMCDDPSMEMDIFHTLDVLTSEAESMLEKEKEVMCQFAFDYNDEYCNNGKVPPVKDYFNQTFNTKQK